MTRRALGPEVAAEAVNTVLQSTRSQFEPVTPDTPLAGVELESIDYVEVFILIEDLTGAVFDLSAGLDDVVTVADLVRLRRLPAELER